MSENIWDHLAPSTRGLLADMARSAKRHKTAELGAVILNTLNPLLMMLVNKHEATSEDVLLTDLRQYVREALGEGNGAIPARPMTFTLFVRHGLVNAACEWLANQGKVSEFKVMDDRGGTDSWRIQFVHSDPAFVGELAKMTKASEIDVQIEMTAGD